MAIITPYSLEYNIFFILTIILLGIKLSSAIYLGKKIVDRKKETGQFSFGFATSVLILISCLFIARIFYFVFDFYLTYFDENTYHLIPNVLFWKIASFSSVIGFSVVIFVVDRKIINFRLKGIPAYIMIIAAIIIIVYPVSTSTDFQIISSLLFFSNVTAIILPFLFFYIGYQSPNFRKPALLIAIAVIIYAVGANILVESLLAFMVEQSGIDEMRIIMYFISMILKTSGILSFSFGVNLFVRKFS